MITAFLIRRWWLTQNRILSSITLALVIPVLLYISIVSVMNNVIVRSIDGIPYEKWVFPGLVMILAILGLFPLLYRDFFDLRIHRKILQPITLAPITKMEIVAGIIITAIIESLIYVVIGIAVLSILISTTFSWLDYLTLTLYIILFNGVMANLFVMVGLLAERVTTYMVVVLGLITFLLFGSGILVEFEFYPSILSTCFSNLPTSVLMRGLRSCLFFNRFEWTTIIYPMILILAWFFVNSILFKIKSKQ